MQPHSARPLVLARWAFLVVVLVGELLGLTIRFDTKSLANLSGWWAGGLKHAALLPQILIAVVAALVVIGAERLKEINAQLLAESRLHRRWPLFFAAHVAAFAGLVLATAYLFEGRPQIGSVPAAVSAGWMALAAATLLLWIAAFAPPESWWRLVRREYPAILAGSCVGAAAWAAGQFTQKLWQPLGDGTFYIVERLLRMLYLGSEIISQPEDRVLGVRDFVVRIAPDCSGYEGIGLVAVFVLAFVWIFRKSLRFPQALVLFPAGIAGVWLANAVRITALIALGTSWSPSVALGGFHSQAGWLAFTSIALGLMACALRFPFFSRIERHVADTECASSTPAHLVPFLVIIAANMLAAAFEPKPGFDSLYPLKVLAAIFALACFHRTYRQMQWSWSWPAIVCGAFVFAIWTALEYASGASRTSTLPQDLAELAPGRAAIWIAFRVAGSVVTVPLAEELAFRGYLMRRMNAADFSRQPYESCSWPSVCVSSFLFGLMHGRWFAGTLAGLMYALVARRRGNLGDAVIAHGITNALVAAAVLAEGAWWLWS